jgi:hypothetical protein
VHHPEVTAANSYRASCNRLPTLTAIFAQLLLNKFVIVKEDPPPSPSHTYQHLSPHFLFQILYHVLDSTCTCVFKGTPLSSCPPIIMYTLIHLSVTPRVIRVGRLLVRILAETRRVDRLRKVQTGSWAQPTSFAVGTKALSRTLSSRDAMLTCHLHLAQWLRVNGAIPLLPLYEFTMWTEETSV